MPKLKCYAFLLILLPAMASAAPSAGRLSGTAVSPDGKTMAVTYVKNGTCFIYKVALETGRASRLTNAAAGFESSPSFAPDGKRIAYSYSAGKGQNSHIVIVNTDGSALHSWPSSSSNDFRPLFTPSNKAIIFARSGYYGSYSPIAQPHSHDWNFYSASLDGANLRQLTNDHFYMVSDASISPDGKNMVFVSSEQRGDVIEIRSVEEPGKPARLLRPHVPKEPRPGPTFNCPNYTPDGKHIVFMAANEGKNGYDYDVFQTDIDTGAVEALTNDNGYATDLKLLPDGKTALFLKWNKDGRGSLAGNDLYLLDIQTRKLTLFKINGLD